MAEPQLPFVSQLSRVGELFQRFTKISAREPACTVGVDIGSTSIKVVALGPKKGGARSIIGQNLVPLEPGQETDVAEPLRNAVETLKLSAPSINLSVSGPWVIMRVVEMPPLKPAEMKQALPFEAQRYLPFNVQEVTLDGTVLGPAADSKKVWVLIVACKKELIERRLDAAKRADLAVALIDVDALAMANGYLATANGRAPEGTRALLNIGAQLSNLVVLRQDVPYLVRDIPWGGTKLLRSVAEQLGGEEATLTKQFVKGELSPEIRGALKNGCEALVAELQLSFDYFENRMGQPPQEVLVCGGLSQSAGFLEALKTHLTQAVSPWTPISGLSGQFAVAYGLALRAF